jgi:hypothetical protein
MDPDQSAASQQAQACLPPPEASVSTPADPPANMSVAPGPADTSSSTNPVLASVPPAASTETDPTRAAIVTNTTAVGGLGAGATGADASVDMKGPGAGGSMTGGNEDVATGAGIAQGVLSAANAGVDASKTYDDLKKGNYGDAAYDGAKTGLDVGNSALSVLSTPGVSQALGIASDTATTLGKYGGAIGGVLGILGGGEDASQGYTDLQSKDGSTQTTGGLEMGKGALEIGGGLATTYGALGGGLGVGLGADIATIGGAAAGTAGGAVLGAGALGIGAGIGLEKGAKASGLFTEDGVVGPDGKPINESGAEKCADWGQDVSNWIDPSHTDENGAFHAGGGTGEGLLDGNFSMAGLKSTAATALGGTTAVLGSMTAGLGMDIAGTAKSIYDWL